MREPANSSGRLKKRSSSQKTHGYKVGQCLRFRKFNVLPGLRTEVYKEMTLLREVLGVPDYDPEPPRYIYLKLTRVAASRLTGLDLLKPRERAVEYKGARWVECDPTDPHNISKMMDFWGFDEVVVLSQEKVREVIEAQCAKLKRAATDARVEARRYRSAIKQLCGISLCDLD